MLIFNAIFKWKNFKKNNIKKLMECALPNQGSHLLNTQKNSLHGNMQENWFDFIADKWLSILLKHLSIL